MTTSNWGLSTVPSTGIGSVTKHNDAMNEIDALMQLAPSEFGVNTPPAHSAGLAVIVGSSPTGAFSSNANDIAVSIGGAWSFFTPEEGAVAWIKGGSTEPNTLIVYDGTEWQKVATGATEQTAVIRITAPALNDQVPLMYTTEAITISEVRSVIFGSSSPEIDWNIMFASSRAAAGTQVFSSDQTTTNTTTGDVDNSGFNDATIPAGNFVWFEFESAPSGTVDALEAFIKFTKDPV